MDFKKQNKELEFLANKNNNEDMAQECNAYMKIKHFMAKRIQEQEREIDDLKSQVVYHSMKHAEMYNLLKTMNEMLYKIKTDQSQKPVTPNNDGLNLSGELAESIASQDFDHGYDKVRIQSAIQSPAKHLNEIVQQDKIITDIKNENLELVRINELIRVELKEKNLTISKIQTEKILILNELNELLNSLQKVDLKALDKFYSLNKLKKIKTFDIPSSLGIKYNIMSAQSQVATLMGSNVVTNVPTLNFEDFKLSQNVEKEQSMLNLEKYRLLMDSYGEEFHSILNKNMKKKKILYSSDSN